MLSCNHDKAISMIDIEIEQHGDVIIIFLRGEFYLESVDRAEETWNEVVAKQPKVVAINCRHIKFIDSSAIGILVKFLNNAMRQKIDLIFYDLNENLYAVFRTAKLENFFTILSKEEFEAKYIHPAP